MKAIDMGILLRIFGVGLVLLAVLGIAGCGKTYSHEDFSRLVLNKSEAEVRTALGEPAWINEGKPATWIYHRITIDAATKKEDEKVSLIFAADAATNQDKVADVRYE